MDPVVHFEIPAADMEKSAAFYVAAFGWTPIPAMPGEYTLLHTSPTSEDGMVQQPGRINGAVMRRRSPAERPNLVVQVDDLAASLARVEAAGGTRLAGPMDIPGIGQYAQIQDPDQNVLALLEPVPERR